MRAWGFARLKWRRLEMGFPEWLIIMSCRGGAARYVSINRQGAKPEKIDSLMPGNSDQ